MDAGGVALVGASAGVLGATVGAAGAILAALIAGRGQGRLQHTHWRRQVRRDAYSRLLTVGNEIYARRAPMSRAMSAGHRYATQEIADDLTAALAAAASGVSLEGPEPAGQAARDLVSLCAEWSGLMLMTNSSGEFRHEHPELAHLAGRDVVAHGDRVRDALDRFEELARAALDAKDGALASS
ncbi:hypothetical protein [Streptomyces sp. NPDC056264]|uniref:hypothetical protein n=1 Tax=Streptomyces sp. NPDC056264 TaxID=3345767 RepID=UPI003AAA2D35